MLDTLKTVLREAGITVYDCAEMLGECHAPYVAAYDHGIKVQEGTKGLLGKHSYDVMCLAPYTDVQGLPALVSRVNAALHGVEGLRYEGSNGTETVQSSQARSQTLHYSTLERLRKEP